MPTFIFHFRTRQSQFIVSHLEWYALLSFISSNISPLEDIFLFFLYLFLLTPQNYFEPIITTYSRTCHTDELETEAQGSQSTTVAIGCQRRQYIAIIRVLVKCIYAGFIGELLLTVPWRNIKNEPIIINVKHVYLIAGPKKTSKVYIHKGEREERKEREKREKKEKREREREKRERRERVNALKRAKMKKGKNKKQNNRNWHLQRCSRRENYHPNQQVLVLLSNNY